MIYSVNVVLWNEYKELLVVSRKEDALQYCLPGGKVDLTDYEDYHREHYYKFFTCKEPDLNTLRRAASRELKEETGVYVRPDDLQPVFTGQHKWKEQDYECTCFWAMCKMLPEVKAVEPGTWVGWRPAQDLIDPRKNPFYDLMVQMFDSLGVR